MPFFEDIGKKITNMGQSAIEKTKCSTETLRLNNQIREEQHLCKDLYQQIGQQYAQQYEANPDPAFEPLMKQLHDAQERIASYQEQIQIKKAAVAQSTVSSANHCCPVCGAPLPPDSKFCTTCGAKVEVLHRNPLHPFPVSAQNAAVRLHPMLYSVHPVVQNWKIQRKQKLRHKKQHLSLKPARNAVSNFPLIRNSAPSVGKKCLNVPIGGFSL